VPSPGGQVAAQAPPATASQTLVARGVDTTQALRTAMCPEDTARRSIVPSTQLANYVVAHSEVFLAGNRRNLLPLMASESGTAGAPPVR